MSEDLEFAFALVLNGASIGLMYSLIALGFVLVYKATDAINFAQGEFVMLAGMIVVTVLGAEAPLIAALVVVLLAMIGFGFGLERVVLRPLLGRPVVAVIMATIGLAAMLRGLTPIVFGSGTRGVFLPIGDEPIVIGPASLPPIQVLGATVAVLFFLAFSWFFKKSRMGDDRRRFGAGRHHLGLDAGRRYPARAGRPKGVSGGDPRRPRLDRRRAD